MIFPIMEHVWKNSQQSGTARLLMVALADHANDHGICWPGVERLSRWVNVTPRQVQRLTRKLVADGEIIVQLGAGRGNSNIYVIVIGRDEADLLNTLTLYSKVPGDRAQEVIAECFNRQAECKKRLEKGDTQDATSQEKVTPEAHKGDAQDKKGDTQDKKGDTQDAKGDATMSPESMNLHKNPQENPHESSAQARDTSAEQFEQLFGSQPEHELAATAHWSEKPWMKCAQWIKPRHGISAECLQRVYWLIEQHTGLEPVDSERSGWVKALVDCYQAAQGDFAAVERGVKVTWLREAKFRPGHARGFVDEIRKARTIEPEVSEHERLRQRMLQDPQYQAGVELERRQREREAAK